MNNITQRLQHVLHSGCCLIYLNLNDSNNRVPINPDGATAAKNIARRLLLHLLSDCTATTITSQDFIRGEYGKPALPGGLNIHFNLSHSSAGIVIALTRHGEVGVDIEDQLFHLRRGMDIAKRFYSAEEFNYLRQLEAQQAKGMMQLIWTLKEAYIKATGRGLSVPLNSFSFGFTQEMFLSFYPDKKSASDKHWLFACWQPELQQHVSLCLTRHQPVEVFEATLTHEHEFIISSVQLNMIRKSTRHGQS